MEKTLQAIHAFVTHKLAEGFDNQDRVVEQAVALFVNQEAYNPSYFAFLQGDETRHLEKVVRPHIGIGLLVALVESFLIYRALGEKNKALSDERKAAELGGG